MLQDWDCDHAGSPACLIQGQSSMFLCGQAVGVAFRDIQLVRTDVDAFRGVSTLAMVFGAKRMETGTTKAVHAVLLRLPSRRRPAPKRRLLARRRGRCTTKRVGCG